MANKDDIVLVTPRQYANIFGIPYKKVKYMLHRGPMMSASKTGGRWQIAITREQMEKGRID